jgi:predicted transglutaminase-like cysteine proteinase
MGKYLISILSGIILGAASISTATALPSTTSMREDGFALAPFSFTKFCIDYPAECPATGGASRVALTPARLAQLAEVNREVNASIAPTPDTSRLRYWHLNVAAGDCNNFAIQKRHELLRRGWPAGALALTVAKTGWGEGHLIVTVRTDQGDLVLDNLRSKIVSWRQTGYHFIMRQSGSNPQFWVALNGGHAGEAFAERDLDGAEGVAAAARPIRTAEVQPARRLERRAGKPLELGYVAEVAAPDDAGRAATAQSDDDAPVAATVDAAPQFGYGQQTARKSGKAGEFVTGVVSWLNQGNLVLADIAPTLQGFVTDFARLANARIADGAAPVAGTSVATAASVIDPTAYGFM